MEMTRISGQTELIPPCIVRGLGFAFELLCMNHISQIKAALCISGVVTIQCSWQGKDESGKRTQIDLLIDRRDGVIDLCEAKFASGLYAITKG